jgi:hypothetical protein
LGSLFFFEKRLRATINTQGKINKSCSLGFYGLVIDKKENKIILIYKEIQKQGVSKRCRLSWLTNSDLVYMPKCGVRGEVAGSQPMSTGAQINFGDLPPYLTYV